MTTRAPRTWRGGGAGALAEHAPTVQAALLAVVGAWPDVLTEVRMSTIRTVTAEGLGLVPLRRPPTGPRRALVLPETPVMSFAEQFAVDVTRIGDELLADYRLALGGAALAGAYAVYVADAVPRARAALDALFGTDAWFDVPLERTAHLPLMIDELVREVALLDALDPVTSELVRLRCARSFRCRVTMARRSLDALDAGATAATFEAVDDYRGSDLRPDQQAALALVDGVVWTPADLRARDLDAVRRHLTPAQAVEVVLDVLRSSVGKVLVALGLDAAPTDGLQLFRLNAAGDPEFP